MIRYAILNPTAKERWPPLENEISQNARSMEHFDANNITMHPVLGSREKRFPKAEMKALNSGHRNLCFDSSVGISNLRVKEVNG